MGGPAGRPAMAEPEIVIRIDGVDAVITECIIKTATQTELRCNCKSKEKMHYEIIP